MIYASSLRSDSFPKMTANSSQTLIRQRSDGEEENINVKQRRSRTACLPVGSLIPIFPPAMAVCCTIMLNSDGTQCRARKSRCAAQPPDPCPSCLELEIPCQWPSEDRRSSNARKLRWKSAKQGGGGEPGPSTLGQSMGRWSDSQIPEPQSQPQLVPSLSCTSIRIHFWDREMIN